MTSPRNTFRVIRADRPSRVAVGVRKATAQDRYAPEDYRDWQRRVLGTGGDP